MEIKTIDDYVERLKEKYPLISEKDIRRIIKFGWRSIYLSNIFGGDVCLKDNNVWMYIGYLRRDPLQHFKYYVRKLALKLRILYKRKKIKWDGYYYFALRDDQVKNYLAQINKRGRPKKHFNFGTVMLYKIRGECELRQSNCRYIFRVPYGVDVGYTLLKRNYKTDKAELILVREPMKFKDILTSNNKYYNVL